MKAEEMIKERIDDLNRGAEHAAAKPNSGRLTIGYVKESIEVEINFLKELLAVLGAK